MSCLDSSQNPSPADANSGRYTQFRTRAETLGGPPPPDCRRNCSPRTGPDRFQQVQSARSLRNDVRRNGLEYNLIQQTRVNGLSKVEGEALLTRFTVIESANLDYQTRDMVALVARVLIGGMPLDVYVTHLYMSRGDDSLRLFQVQQLLAWIDARDEVPARIVCGDFQCPPRCALRRPDGQSFPSDADVAYRVYAACRPRWLGVASLLATDGSMHRLHLGVRRARNCCKRDLL